MPTALSKSEVRQLVESLSMCDFREKLLRKVPESKELSALISFGASALSTDDRNAVISILTEALPSLVGHDFSDEELDRLAEATMSRAVSLR